MVYIILGNEEEEIFFFHVRENRAFAKQSKHHDLLKTKKPHDGLSIHPLGLNALSHFFMDVSHATKEACRVLFYCLGGGG